MKQFNLNKKLVWEITPSQKEEIFNALVHQTKQPYSPIFFSFFDLFIGGKESFIGTIKDNEFVLRDRTKIWNSISFRIKLKGKIEESNNGQFRLIVKVETHQFLVVTIASFYAFILIFSGILLGFSDIHLAVALITSFGILILYLFIRMDRKQVLSQFLSTTGLNPQ